MAEEDPESIWLRETYQPNAVNLTVRAVVGGMLVGAVLCLSNLYVFFKTGWSIGVTLTACIVAFGVFRLLNLVGARRLDVHENNALTTVASGAGYMTAGGNMAAFGALMMITTVRPDGISMMAWFAVIAALGVFAAIPIKRQLVNKEALPFPTGRATAETLASIHGALGSGIAKLKALGYAALVGGAVGLLRDIVRLVPEQFAIVPKFAIAIKVEVVLFGAGALMSFRTGWSMLVAAMFTYGVLAPSLLDAKLIPNASYKSIVGWTVWPGAAILVGAGLTAFALDFKSLVRALSGLGKIFGKRDGKKEEGIAAVEAPDWWFPAGFMVLSPIIVALMSILFQIPIWAACIAIPLAIVMGFVAARVTGETDITPTKALGPVTQITYGAMTPGNLTGNIMAANVTGGIGLHAADLLTTLKTGWLIGAKPRHQLYAQLFGVIAGAIVIVPAFDLIIPDPSVLGGDDWPAPSCVVWAGVSKAFSGGLGALDDRAKLAIVVGLALGIALALVDKFAPSKLKTYIPSPYGIGLAMVVPWGNSLAIFCGAGIAALIAMRNREWAKSYIVPIASGLIMGESLMGVIRAILLLLDVIPAK